MCFPARHALRSEVHTEEKLVGQARTLRSGRGGHFLRLRLGRRVVERKDQRVFLQSAVDQVREASSIFL